ncbi:30S ribosomal protein S15 [Rickettsiales endosymbiont of Peranema trichophorum]|uniref:30S ribosomal protein S15 n=1 Tax=Rickettsiales endosymbiont of Peranema trichophorum TaxID=2486577 RepID=UPI001023F2D0|nr:30S ribosomal protein S15 [Rickettsiales endosymbiont of Peranema trichophorum]RZI46318.1 30S ribosomal protein S15 [Rickettsiales endosymbiont of Peranema trichophorum]
MSITKENKKQVIETFALAAGDTGSVEVQVAVLSSRILTLTEHFKLNPKDFQSRKGLLVLVNRRRKLLSYLKRKEEKRYQALIARLGLRK